MESAGGVPGPGYRWADFVRLRDEDDRELVDGRLMEIEMPTKLHEWIVAVLVRLLGNWAAENGGMALPSGYKVKISERRGVMPDVLFLRPGNIAVHGPQGIESGHPDLVVEVVSQTSSRYDRVEKREWYASIGVPEYWIVDPDAQTVERLILEAGAYREAETLSGEARFAPGSFPGLEIALASLWTMPE